MLLIEDPVEPLVILGAGVGATVAVAFPDTGSFELLLLLASSKFLSSAESSLELHSVDDVQSLAEFEVLFFKLDTTSPLMVSSFECCDQF